MSKSFEIGRFSWFRFAPHVESNTQSVKFGETKEEAESIYTDAITLEEAGCFAIIAEMLDQQVATELSRQILPPLIGIGCGDGCDGQILVTTDVLGWSHGQVPKFVKPYLNMNKLVSDALDKYVDDVRLKKENP